MAGDWIKLEITTPDKPEVVKLSALLGIDQDAVLGKLIRFWIWVDQQSVTGDDVPVTAAFIDRLVFHVGFAAELVKVGWLSGRDGALTIPHFDRHNGQSAKARAMDNRKKASQRERDKLTRQNRDVCPENVPLPSGPTAGQNTGPEKRREEYREREGSAGVLKIETIRNSYPRRDCPRECNEAIESALHSGEDPDGLLALVKECAKHINAAPGGSSNRLAPSARSFFTGQQWQHPEVFANRWKPNDNHSRPTPKNNAHGANAGRYSS